MTKIDNIFKSKVFKAAGKIFNKYKVKSLKNWSKALTRAWAWAKQKLVAPVFAFHGEVLAETEKAVKFSANTYCHLAGDISTTIWLPKSQILKMEESRIVVTEWIKRAKAEELRLDRKFY